MKKTKPKRQKLPARKPKTIRKQKRRYTASTMKKTHLIMIDPQNDFCDKQGRLFVAGADRDMAVLAPFITKNSSRLSEINCTLDSHQTIHIAHAIFWINSKGEHPAPFTVISREDVKNGVWRTFNPRWQTHALFYTEELAKDTPTHKKRYDLIIWPTHCRIGSWGHMIVPAVFESLAAWEEKNFNKVNFIAKGSNILTEHYSAVQADVPDANDVSTKLNTNLIDILSEADVDEILITGEALSHCVANTITDIANNFGDDNIKKFTLLTNTSSNVTGFEKLGQQFVSDMVKRGMKTTTTNDW